MFMKKYEIKIYMHFFSIFSFFLTLSLSRLNICKEDNRLGFFVDYDFDLSFFLFPLSIRITYWVSECVFCVAKLSKIFFKQHKKMIKKRNERNNMKEKICINLNWIYNNDLKEKKSKNEEQRSHANKKKNIIC